MADQEQPPIPPRKEDILFREGLPDWWNNACLNSVWGVDEHGYTEGYRRGARLLVEQVIEEQRDQDYLVYPIVFLYRRHIELALKNIILHTPYVIECPLTNAEKQHLDGHRLDLLWQDLKPMFAAVCKAAGWDTLSPDDGEGIDSYIRQLTDFDANSHGFRYPRKKNWAPSLPSDLKRLNLRHFAEMVERLADYLDVLSVAVISPEGELVDMEASQKNYT